jgi:hypothetical protein
MGAYHRTLGTYLNLAIGAGWYLDQMMEPELVAIESGTTAPKSDLPGLLMLRFSKR